MNHDSNVTAHRQTNPLRRFSIRSSLVVVTVLGIAFGLLSQYLQNHRSDIRRIFGGAAGFTVLRNADRIEAYRLGELPEEISWQDAKASNYPITAGPVVVPAGVTKQITTLMQNPKSYGWDTAKSCEFRPGVRLDLIHGNNRLQILICFECDTLTNFLNGKMVGGEDFDLVRGALVRAMRRLFPDDPAIKSLSESR